MTTLLPLLLATQLLQAPSAPTAPGLSAPIVDLVTVETPTRRHFHRLLALAADVEPHQPLDSPGQVRILSTDAEQQLLRSAGFRLHVLQEDLTAFYAERAAAASSLPAGAIGLTNGGSMGGFKTLAEIEQALVQLTVVHPSLVSPPISLGLSHESRPIQAFRLSTTPLQNDSAKPTVWFDALHHAREPMSAEALLRFAELLASSYNSDPELTRLVATRNFVFIPCVNPDGYAFNELLSPSGGGTWRKNMYSNAFGLIGVDLNRNYDWHWGPGYLGSSSSPGSSKYHGPSAFSEPETRALRDFFNVELPEVAVSAHAYANAWVFPWGYDALLTTEDSLFRDYAQLAASPAGWDYGAIWETLYFANGSSLDWMYGSQGCKAFAVEIGSLDDGYWPTPQRADTLFEEALEGFLVASRVAGAWVQLRGLSWAEVSGDGDAFREAGESWDLTASLENIGLQQALGDIELNSNSQYFLPAPGALSFQIAANSTQAVGPLRIDISSSAPSSLPFEVDLDLTWDGVTDRLPVPIVLGQSHLLLFDGMQNADFGWSVSMPGSAAWERAVPSGTSAQPGSDHSSLATGKCWVTGASGGPADANDVDGETRLLSPVFRAAGLGNLELGYACWFGASAGNVAGDELLIEISNDAGVSWTLLESAPSSSSWQVPSFALQDILPLTDSMRLRLTVRDGGGDDTVEALLDDLALRTIRSLPSLGLWGETSLGEPFRVFLDHPDAPQGNYRLLWSLTAGGGMQTPGVDGRLYLTGNVRTLLSETSQPSGRAVIPLRIPNVASFQHLKVYMQVLADEGGANAAYSNLVEFEIR